MSGGLPLVSVVVVNYNGAGFLADCLKSLLGLDYPPERLELVLVDNGSRDRSLEVARQLVPGLTVIACTTNLGFAAGSNLGARQARGEFLAFLNNDMRVDPGWLTGLLEPLVDAADPGLAATSSKILSWDGSRIDFAGASLNFAGHGFQTSYDEAYVPGTHEEVRPLLFPCAGSMLIKRDVFLAAGGFDEDYFAYFEDVDLGWRLWVLGHAVAFAPRSVVYHHHQGTSRRFRNHGKAVLYARNALYTLIKNYDTQNLQRVLPAALLINARLAAAWGGIDPAEYELTEGPDDQPADQVVRRDGMAHLVALSQVASNLTRVFEKRHEVQQRRRRSDAEIIALFGDSFLPAYWDPRYVGAHRAAEAAFGLEEHFPGPATASVLVVAGADSPRARQLAGALAGSFPTRLAAPVLSTAPPPGVEGISCGDQGSNLMPALLRHEIVVVGAGGLELMDRYKEVPRHLVIDLGDRDLADTLIRQLSGTPPGPREQARETVLEYLTSADYVICASKLQRDLIIGMLGAVGRINAERLQADPALEGLVGVVPPLVEPAAPVHQAVAGPVSLVWSGDLGEAADLELLLDALVEARGRGLEARLWLPAQDSQEAWERAAAPAFARGVPVQCLEPDAAPWRDRAEPALAVRLIRPSAASRYGPPTAFSGAVSRGLALLTTAGTADGELVHRFSAGVAVPAGEAGAVVAALAAAGAEPRAWSAGIEAARAELGAPGPLLAYCRHPRVSRERLGTLLDRESFHGRLTALVMDQGEIIATLKSETTGLHEYVQRLETSLDDKESHVAELKQRLERVEAGAAVRLAARLERLTRWLRR